MIEPQDITIDMKTITTRNSHMNGNPLQKARQGTPLESHVNNPTPTKKHMTNKKKKSARALTAAGKTNTQTIPQDGGKPTTLQTAKHPLQGRKRAETARKSIRQCPKPAPRHAEAATGAAVTPPASSSQHKPKPLAVSDKPAGSAWRTRTVPVGNATGNSTPNGRSFVDARKFHSVVLPGTDFNEWLDMASTKYPDDFGVSDNGEDPTISLLRARYIAFMTPDYLSIEVMKIIQEVQASGVADPGDVVNARLDDLFLTSGSNVGGVSGERESAQAPLPAPPTPDNPEPPPDEDSWEPGQRSLSELIEEIECGESSSIANEEVEAALRKETRLLGTRDRLWEVDAMSGRLFCTIIDDRACITHTSGRLSLSVVADCGSGRIVWDTVIDLPLVASDDGAYDEVTIEAYKRIVIPTIKWMKKQHDLTWQ